MSSKKGVKRFLYCSPIAFVLKEA